ncbi:ABC transporter substrate-binding protein [Azospirillum sp. RWY-5-1]|uniref:ABC transporter substrate-binding protein n=1 Tax=Azospirillum oleiclasticum TaxID=2735135 RepID=A0ABX2T8H6_9PROT|nr:ABC transporter substrate-binding protein [Azospirillum oleiclasticum]NYZ12391.1 ABC transporter substrate-binding protein [Azospirillum oleiclasticum]NYZ19552.1 ABC transporter substrate-binding protein [Azospirillum oleiclasticum]
MKRILMGAGLGMVAALALAAPANAAKTLVYCSEGSPENFNPSLNTTGTSHDVSLPVYNNLVEFDRGTTKVIPALAESWTVSDDGLVYTFALRKGVKFHAVGDFKPTRDFTADDVIFSFERQWKKENPFHKVSGGAYDYFADMSMPDLLKSIEKVDDHTVRFTLNKVEAPFIANLAMPFASIMSAEYADAMLKKNTPEKVDQTPVGTGPFQFVAYQKDAVIRYKAFEQYWGGRQPLDNLVFAITPDAAVRYAKLKAGECHVASYPNPADIPAMKSDPAVTVMEQEGLNVGYVAFNVSKKPFDDVRVRRAVSMAVDKKTIVDAVYQGAGKPAKNPIPPTMWSYNDKVEDYPYDVEKAKKLLADAGLANGFEIDLWAMPVQRPYNPNAKRMAEMIQADLAKVGIKATIKQFEWGEYRKRLQAGEHQFGMLGWTGDNGDPDNFLYTLLGCEAARVGGNNIAKWCNDEFNGLITEAKRTTDQAARTKLYEQAQVIFKEETPWLPMAHSVVYMALSPKVVGYKMDPFGLHPFAGVDMKQ